MLTNKLRLSPLRIAVDMYQHFFLSIQAMDQAMLTWALEIPTSKEIVEGQAHMPGPMANAFIFSLFLQGTRLEEGGGEDSQ